MLVEGAVLYYQGMFCSRAQNLDATVLSAFAEICTPVKYRFVLDTASIQAE